jgi:hypothetical protein
MKRNIKLIAVVVALLAVFALAAASSPQVLASGAWYHTCSNATLSGSYGASLSGTVNGLPFDALDLVVADGQGNMTGTGTIVYNGAVMPTSFTATYSVNADCTGSFASSTGTNEDFIISQDGSQVQIIVTANPAGPSNVVGLANNLARK